MNTNIFLFIVLCVGAGMLEGPQFNKLAILVIFAMLSGIDHKL